MIYETDLALIFCNRRLGVVGMGVGVWCVCVCVCVCVGGGGGGGGGGGQWMAWHSSGPLVQFCMMIFKMYGRNLPYSSLRPSDALSVSNLTIFDSDNGLSPGRRHTIIWTNHTNTFKKMLLKMLTKRWPFCLGLGDNEHMTSQRNFEHAWWHKSGSTYAQSMICCLRAPSQYQMLTSRPSLAI